MSIRRFAAWSCFSLLLGFGSTASAAPCAGFTDVQDSSGFCIHIEWLKNRAITLGCTATQYCPADFVRRDQMAAFLYRLGVQNAFLQGGNAFGSTAILGTNDNRAVQVNASGARALSLVPATNTDYGPSVNIVGGHFQNRVQVTCSGICVPTPEPPVGAVVAGGGYAGNPNHVTDSFGVVSGGWGNRAGNDDANQVDANGATVSGGVLNIASGRRSAIGGGLANLANGDHATIPGGRANVAQGAYSFAAGYRSYASSDGCFVWGDATDPPPGQVEIYGCGANEFIARATGGVYFQTAYGFPLPQGVFLGSGDTSWSSLSDRTAKENWRDIDPRQVLERLAAVPIGEWNYRVQSDAIRHMGPSAQDFRAAFGLGRDDRTISTIDADGVALAAIQGLNRKLEQEVATLAARNTALEAALTRLESKLEASLPARTAPSNLMGGRP